MGPSSVFLREQLQTVAGRYSCSFSWYGHEFRSQVTPIAPSTIAHIKKKKRLLWCNAQAVYTSLPEQRPQILYELLLVVKEPTSDLFLMKFGQDTFCWRSRRKSPKSLPQSRILSRVLYWWLSFHPSEWGWLWPITKGPQETAHGTL